MSGISSHEKLERMREMGKLTEVEKVITEHMHMLGVAAHLKGYYYIRTALMMTIDDPSVVGQITKLLYPDLAKQYKTSDGKVERAIRNAIEMSWERGSIDVQDEIFGYTKEDGNVRPTNSEYLIAIADHIQFEHMHM